MPRSLRSPQQQALQALLVAARRSNRLTQAEVAMRLNRPQSFVAKYERGERRLDLIEFIEVTAALQVDPVEVLKILLSNQAG
ncbi:MAG: helix-turn-helix transcriptional regulator [Caulobacteraceae bacterium]|nr:helix-turn-helix transcriptional regulator [Caulobacteraceae bacterium]